MPFKTVSFNKFAQFDFFRQAGQPLNLSKSLEDLPKMQLPVQPSMGSLSMENGVHVVKTENVPKLGSPKQPQSEEMTVS